jgi:epoxyqueuosine reductase
VNLTEAEPGLKAWLAAGFHGSMNYMASHGLKRARPAESVPGTVSVITVRMDYLPSNEDKLSAETAWQSLEQAQQGVVSVYARGRDYHKVLRSRLQKLQERMAALLGPFGHRVFTDSAPVMEAELAVRSGLGLARVETPWSLRKRGRLVLLFGSDCLRSSASLAVH